MEKKITAKQRVNQITITVQQWIDALRSGKYKQTTGALYQNQKYCCLGVACRVGGATFHEGNVVRFLEKNSICWDDTITYKDQEYGFTDDEGNLVGFMAEDLEASIRNFTKDRTFKVAGRDIPFMAETKRFGHLSLQGWLASLNDEYSATFEEIAAFIEKVCNPKATL